MGDRACSAAVTIPRGLREVIGARAPIGFQMPCCAYKGWLLGMLAI